MLVKTKGLVLKQRSIGEQDKIITILSEDLGVIEATAKNVKRAKSGLASVCEILSYCQFNLYSNYGKYIVNGGDSQASFYSLRTDVQKIALAGYFCELMTTLQPTSENAKSVLKLALNTLHLLKQGAIPMDMLKSIFQLRVMCLTGFMPGLVCCEGCNCYESEKMYFFPKEGILLCEECLKNQGHKGQSIELSKTILTAMRHIIFSDDFKIFSFKITTEAIRFLDKITEYYVLCHTEKRFNSLEMYKTLR